MYQDPQTAVKEPVKITLSGLPHQLKLWSDQTTQQLAMVGGLGCGKTYGLGVKQMLFRLANKACDGMFMVPTLGMAERIHKREWVSLWSDFGIDVKIETFKNAFLWPWGARTWIVSAEEPDRAKGINAGDAMIDEPGQISREAFDVLCSRVRNPKSAVKQVALGGTPEGLNWFADLFSNPRPDSGRRTIHATCWHADLGDYPERLMKTYGYDPGLRDTYIKGEFVPLRHGRAYKFFKKEMHVQPTTWDPYLTTVLSCDFNVDNMRWVVMQFPRDAIVVLDEIALGTNGSTEAAAREFADRWGKKIQRRTIKVTGDAAGKHRSTKASTTDYDVIESVLRSAELRASIDVPSTNPLVKDRIQLVNRYMSEMSNKQFIIDPRCEQLIRDFERVTWKQGGNDVNQTTDPTLSHASSACGYAVCNYAPYLGAVRGTVGSKVLKFSTSNRSENAARVQW